MLEPNRKFIGFVFILTGLLVNEVTIALLFKGWYAFYKINLPIRLSILALQVFFISTGWLIIKGRTLNWFVGLYRGFSLFMFNVILLVALFFGWFAYKDKQAKVNWIDKKVFSPYYLLKEKPELMETIYPGLSREQIGEIILTPINITSHPTLEFMQTPIRSNYYNVGFENMRYSFAVNEHNAASSMNGSTWVFGGSTVFGSGVGDDDTIPAHLNQLGKKGNIFINFGVQASLQNNEIEKLLLLLKKGWRPKRVVFVDGLNDILAMSKYPFHPAETPARNLFGFNFALENFDRFLDSIKVAIQRRFPPHPKQLYPKDFYENVYQIESPYQKYSVAFFNFFYHQSGNLSAVPKNPEQYADKLDTLYRMNLEFLKHLGSTFGFSFYVFFQPLGLLNLENPFIDSPETYQNWSLYKAFNSIVPLFRERIKNNPIAHFYDTSDADKKCPACYVDLTHYNSKLNATIAQRILERLDSSGKMEAVK